MKWVKIRQKIHLVASKNKKQLTNAFSDQKRGEDKKEKR